jgi:hypothetical protein
LGHPITVYHSWEPIELDEDESALGCAHLLTNQIGICHKVEDAYVSESMTTEAFLHEIFHHVSSKLGMGLEEIQIAGMSCGLLHVLRDNKLDFLNTDNDMPKKKGK